MKSAWMWLLAGGSVVALAAPPFAPAGELPEQSSVPELLLCRDGTVVATADDWRSRRVPELKALFQHYMYGHLPPPPRAWQAELGRADGSALAGRATLQEVTLRFGGLEAPRLNLLMVIPNQVPPPVPVILGVNFCGNHAVLPDPQITLPAGWMPRHCPGCPDHRATEEGRGKDAPSWDVAQVLDRGFALATFYHGDLEPDYPEAPDGIRALATRKEWRQSLASPSPDTRCPACPGRYEQADYDWGTLAAWAWGFHRAVDYLVTDRRFDPNRVAVFGHSRNGKTALLAAAFDERIALVLCHQSGCGGAAPSRGTVGESVKQINDRFPHWFNAAFKQFNEAPQRLPFDQHALIALCAPRPVLLSNATEDQWANPAGQFEMLVAASPAYQLLGVPGLESPRLPSPGTLVSSRLGYFLRHGKHSTTPEDWKAFLDFAQAQWERRPGR